MACGVRFLMSNPMKKPVALGMVLVTLGMVLVALGMVLVILK